MTVDALPWLQEAPAHWRMQRLDHVASLAMRQVEVGRINAQEVFHYSIPMVQATGSGAVEDGGDIASSKLLVDQPMVLIAKLNPRKGTVCLADPQEVLTVCSTEFVPIVPKRIHREFLYYVLSSEPYRTRLEAMVTSVTNSHQRVDPSEIIKVTWGLPPPEEQRRIAAFLDHETARIDELVHEQERLGRLVREARGAAITTAVFGVSDAVPRVKLALLAEILPGHTFESADFSDSPDGVRLLRGVNVSVNRLRWDETVYWPFGVDSRLSRYALQEGDVVFGMDRPWISAGARQAVVRKGDLPALLVQRVARLRPRANVLSELLSFALESGEFRAFVEADLTGVSVPHISGEQIGSFRIPVLPMDVQRGRVSSVNARLALLDQALAESERLVELLQERRSALITAAVTGQIDVSNWTPPDDWLSTEAA